MLQSRLNRQEDLTAATKRADALARELNLAVSRAKEDLAAYQDEIENLKKVSWNNVKVDCFFISESARIIACLFDLYNYKYNGFEIDDCKFKWLNFTSLGLDLNGH